MLRASAAGRDLGLIAPEERTLDDVSLLPQDLAARTAGPAPAQAGPSPRQPDAPLSVPPPTP
jgi:hypothetical protein